jgi:hypothetical protein
MSKTMQKTPILADEERVSKMFKEKELKQLPIKLRIKVTKLEKELEDLKYMMNSHIIHILSGRELEEYTNNNIGKMQLIQKSVFEHWIANEKRNIEREWKRIEEMKVKLLRII